MSLSKEDMEKFLRLGFIQHTRESWEQIPKQKVEAFSFDDEKPKLTEAEYNAKVKTRLNFTPLQLMRDGFSRNDDSLPVEKYEENATTGLYTCHLHKKKKVYSGTFRDKHTAAHIAATYFLEDAISNGNSEYFFLPRDKKEALKHMEAKREALMKLVKESGTPSPSRCINEYAQFYGLKIKNECTDGPPYTATLEFEGVTYKGESAPTKKESKSNTAKIIYDKLVDSGKYQEYQRAKAEKKAKGTEDHDFKAVSESTDKSTPKVNGSNNTDQKSVSNEATIQSTSELKNTITAETFSK